MEKNVSQYRNISDKALEELYITQQKNLEHLLQTAAKKSSLDTSIQQYHEKSNIEKDLDIIKAELERRHIPIPGPIPIPDPRKYAPRCSIQVSILVALALLIAGYFVFIMIPKFIEKTDSPLTAVAGNTPTVQPAELMTTVPTVDLITPSIADVQTDDTGSTDILKQCLAAPQHILFTSDRLGSEDIFTMNADGSNVKQLVDNINSDNLARWSPDRQQIVFVSKRDETAPTIPDLYIMNADGSNVRRLTTDSGDDPRWSPDGEYIAYSSKASGNWDIRIIKPDGTFVRDLTKNSSTNFRPAWSPDGSKIAYDVRLSNTVSDIHIINSDGTGDTTIVSDGTFNIQPVWSPNGQQLTFTRARDKNFEIYTINQDGSNINRITNDAAIDTDSVWSPDGKCIVFESNRSGSQDVWMIDVQGKQLKNLTDNTPDSNELYVSWIQ